MFRLALILHVFIGATLAGTAVVVTLVVGYDTPLALMGAVLLGFIVATPISVAIARRLLNGPGSANKTPPG